MTVFIHSGSSKAGSTAIQTAITRNFKKIRAMGYRVPTFRTTSGRNINSNMATLVSFGSDEKLQSRKARIDLLGIDTTQDRDEFRREIQKCTANKNRSCVLSAECIDTFLESQLEDMREVAGRGGQDIVNIYYLRSPYSLLCSSIPFLVRRGKVLSSPETFLGTCIRSDSITRMTRVFENTEIYPYKHISAEPGKVPGHFFERIFGEADFDFKTKNANSGLSNIATRLLGALNREKDHEAETLSTDASALDADLKTIRSLPGEKFLLSETELGKARAFLERENDEIEVLLGNTFTDDEYPHLQGPQIFSETELDHLARIWGDLSSGTRRCLEASFPNSLT